MRLHDWNSPVGDLNAISHLIGQLREDYVDSKILIYGGTGFIGTWLTESLVYANKQLDLHLTISVVTRNKSQARIKFRHPSCQDLRFVEHDFALSELNHSFEADYIFHGSTPTRGLTGSGNEVDMFNSSINAAKHAIKARSNKFLLPRVTHLSSGAIYGAQPIEMKLRSEKDYAKGGVGRYAEAKVEVDQILSDAQSRGKIIFQSPRLFAFAGPLLQMDAHFAVGNFLLDGLSKRPIRVKGNPDTIRSYMYPADLIVAILRIATEEKYQDFNIGSEQSITMSDLATLISSMTSNSSIEFTNPNAVPSNYVPSILSLKEIMPQFKPMGVYESISKWIEWIEVTNQLTKEG